MNLRKLTVAYMGDTKPRSRGDEPSGLTSRPAAWIKTPLTRG